MQVQHSAVCFVILFFGCETAEVWFVPTKTFLVTGRADLRCFSRYDGFNFKKNFEFFKDNKPLQEVGGGPHEKVANEPVVYYNLAVNGPGVYTCRVGSQNTTAEIFATPDDPPPVVVEVGKNTNISCPSGPASLRGKLEIAGGNTQTDRDTVVVHHAGEQDGYIKFLCRYKFPLDNVTVTSTPRLIVVKTSITTNSSWTFRTFTCTAFTNLTNISIRLMIDGKDFVYSKLNSYTVSEDDERNSTNATCSIWYKGQELWSTEISSDGNRTRQANNNGILTVLLKPIIIGSVFLVVAVVIMAVVAYRCLRKREREYQQAASSEVDPKGYKMDQSQRCVEDPKAQNEEKNQNAGDDKKHQQPEETNGQEPEAKHLTDEDTKHSEDIENDDTLHHL